MRIPDLMPNSARQLLSGSGRGLVSQIGIDILRGAVYDVLCGHNLRDATEMLTRRRIAQLNAATFVMFLRGESEIQDFSKLLPELACENLKAKTANEERWILQWTLGLTDKAFQNVLRDDPNALEEYKRKYLNACAEVIDLCKKEYGALDGEIRLDSGEKATVNWNFMVKLLGTVGAQTLAIRGSEKSMYGKLFEQLILGSLLHILGFEHVSKEPPRKLSGVFWLAERAEKRESDATVLLGVGKGVRFDIGFIGRGNPEITLDKVSRFEREIQYGARKWYMATIIIVDRIGVGGRIETLAQSIGGSIVQMSMSYWPKQVAQILSQKVKFKHPLANMPEQEIGGYLRDQLLRVPLLSLLEDIKI